MRVRLIVQLVKLDIAIVESALSCGTAYLSRGAHIVAELPCKMPA